MFVYELVGSKLIRVLIIIEVLCIFNLVLSATVTVMIISVKFI